jgi:hypothetical protein
MKATAKPMPPRQRACRALYRLANLPEDTKHHGRPMWQSFLPEVDAVLEAALPSDQLKQMLEDEEAY